MNSNLRGDIAQKAYDLYEKSGRQKGNDLLHWLAAEKIVFFTQIMHEHASGKEIPLLEYHPTGLSYGTGTPERVATGTW
jgi:hypothetical protein